jgi:hypothetical protein
VGTAAAAPGSSVVACDFQTPARTAETHAHASPPIPALSAVGGESGREAFPCLRFRVLEEPDGPEPVLVDAQHPRPQRVHVRGPGRRGVQGPLDQPPRDAVGGRRLPSGTAGFNDGGDEGVLQPAGGAGRRGTSVAQWRSQLTVESPDSSPGVAELAVPEAASFPLVDPMALLSRIPAPSWTAPPSPRDSPGTTQKCGTSGTSPWPRPSTAARRGSWAPY